MQLLIYFYIALAERGTGATTEKRRGPGRHSGGGDSNPQW